MAEIVGIPSALQVGPWSYAIVVDDAAMDAASVASHSDLLGHADHRHLTITLRPDQAYDMAADTLLHESLHALSCLTGLHEDLGDDEEGVVTRLAPALLDLLRRNPDPVAYLTDRG